MTAVRFLSWVLGVAFTLGFADSFVNLTHRMGVAAVHAHQQDQISYARYNKLLWSQSVPNKKDKTIR